MFGQSCCRKRVTEWKCISLGFGQKVYHNKPKMVDSFYGEWEIASYFCAWRIVQDGRIICGSNETVDSTEELDAIVNKIDFGRIISLKMSLAGVDVRAEFDTDIEMDFFFIRSGDDESINIFCPDDMCATFSVIDGWLIGKSNKPGKLVRESEWSENG